jgi:hypothetical protein
MQNLRDKLVRAGLVTTEQAAEAAERPVKARVPGPVDGASGPLIPVRPQPPARVPPLPGTREAQRLESKRQLEQDREVRERVAGVQVPLEPGQRAFYFVTRRNRLRRLELADAQAAALEAGALAVVERPDPGQIEHTLVPAAAAEALLRDFPRAVRFFNRHQGPVGFVSEEELRARQTAEAVGPAGSEQVHSLAIEAPDAPSDAGW